MAWKHSHVQRGLDISVHEERTTQARFGMMFPDLAPFAPAAPLLEALANTMMDPDRPGHPDPAGDNPAVPSGFTYLSQFIDHDLTRDDTPLTGRMEDPHATENFRTPSFDLDNVYGLGSDLEPFLYDGTDAALLSLTTPGADGAPSDLIRLPSGTAVIGDSRNDENLLIAQLHIAFIKFHNAVATSTAATLGAGATTSQVFRTAQTAVRHHYQWMLVHEFLPLTLDQSIIDDILTEHVGGPAEVKLKFYQPTNLAKPFMPVEFSAAAYRFGHSTVRNGYRMNANTVAPLFDLPQSANDLHGSRPLPASLTVDWTMFFQIPGLPAPANVTRKIDHFLATGLFKLPTPQVVGPPPLPPIQILALRNLLRGVQFGLPAGQDVANTIGAPVLSNTDLGEPLLADPGFGGKAPLWYYILKEAELTEGGVRLGAVGGRIVAEVFLGLLHFSSSSYLNLPNGFAPEQPYAPAGTFGMAELLKFGGAV